MPNTPDVIARATRPLRAAAKAAVFFLKVFPMLPSRPVDWLTKPPVVERVTYPTSSGQAEGDLYRPSSGGPHPGIVVCLGVVPFEVDHPQVPVLGRALARAGFAALLYWSPAMRDLRLDPGDVENIALAYRWLTDLQYVDPTRSGLLGTCVGGSFALMASASSLVRGRVAFVSAYAPFSSMWTLAQDVASGTCVRDKRREPWRVDQLTRRVFVHSLTASLEPHEAERLRDAYAVEGGRPDHGDLSAEGEAVRTLLTAADADAARIALDGLSPHLCEQLTAMSPMSYLDGMQAPLIALLHDRGDQVIPIGESRRLRSALDGRAGVHFTEMQFQHLDPLKGRLPLPRLVRELAKFLGAVYPLFRCVA